MPQNNRERRTYSAIFVDTLRKLSGDQQTLIGNIALRDELGWGQERYDRIKWQLFDANEIIVGRGRGGAVALAKTKETKALSVFISYSHEDEEMEAEFLKHLEPLRRQNLIEDWHFRKIKAGEDWGRAISAQLESAKIILLLVSIDFINSNYCYDIELQTALELNEQKKARVIPIILRSCLWNRSPFAKLQALPKDAKAVASWPDRDEAFTNIADGIRQVAEELLGIKP